MQNDSGVGERDFAQEVERNLRWNFFMGGGEAAFYWLGILSLASMSTVMPLYVRHLTPSPLIIAMVGAIPGMTGVGWLLPQILSTPFVEHLPRKLPFTRWCSLFTERTAILVMAAGAFLLSKDNPRAALAVFMFALCWHSFGTGVLATAWQDVLAKIMPVRWRGRYFGVTNFVGAAMGIPGAMLAGAILGRFGYPQGFALCFLLAYLAAMISWGFQSGIREPVGPVLPRSSFGAYLRRLDEILHRDGAFGRFLVARAVMTLGEMANGFVAVYAVSRFGLSDRVAGQFAAAMVAGTLLANLLVGFVGDRYGHKLGLEVSALAAVVGMALALVGRSPLWFDLVFAMQGAATAGYFLAGMAIIFEFCPPELRPTYIGLGNTVVGVAIAVVPFVGGAVVAALGYTSLFMLALALRVAGWAVLRWYVREPRQSAAPGQPANAAA